MIKQEVLREQKEDARMVQIRMLAREIMLKKQNLGDYPRFCFI